MVEKLDQFELGRRIRAARESVNMTRDDLAEQVDISRNFLADIEGGTKGVSLQNFYKIARALDVSTDYLLETKHMDGGDKERVILVERIRGDMDMCDFKTLELIARIIRDIKKTFQEDDE